MAEKATGQGNNDSRFPAITPEKPTSQTPYISPIIGKLGYDTRYPWLFGLGVSPNNGVDFHVFLSFDGLNFDDNDIDKIWNGGAGDRVKREVDSATAEIPAVESTANSAVKLADSAIAASKVNSDAIVAQSEAISEAKSAMDSATAEIQQTAANAASDAAKIRADVAQVQNEVDTAKAANSASVEVLKSDVSAAKQDLADVHDSLTKAQAAAEESQKAIDNSIAQINSDIEQDRKDIASAQQANADTAKQLDTYSKQAQDQGKTIKSIQDKQDGFTATLADVQGNVTQVSDKVDGLSASLKDAQDNVASVKAQADQLSATLTDHSKDIANLTATAKELSSTLEDASGRLSKVEQTASEQSTTLSDVQGNLSQVKQTADGLVTTLKDAQGNIDQIKQTAKGTAEQLSNAQGDITALQKDVDGVKLTIADHDKNIHALQADSKSLQDDMEDAKGNISTLQKTSTSITSELKDHDGRMSKVEQTASTLTNEFSDQQGRLNRVEQTANGTQQTVADQQGQINTIKTDAAGIHETLTGQGNQIATINVTLNGLKSQYEGVSGDLDKLKNGNQWKIVKGAFDANQYTQAAHVFYQDTQAKNTPNPGWFYFIVEAPGNGRVTQNLIKDNSDDSWSRYYAGKWSTWTKGVTNLDVTSLSDKVTANSTQITQTKMEIDLKADQDTVNNLTGEVSQTKAQLKVQAGQISSKVSSEDFKTLDGKVGGAIAQIQKNSTAIDQTDKKISLKADQTEVDKIKGTASHNSSRLDVLANEIKSKVSSTDVNNIVDGKGYATSTTVQSLLSQKAGQLNESITNLEGKFKASSGINLAQKTNQGTTNWGVYPGTGASTISEVNVNGARGVRFTQTRKSTSWWVITYKLDLDYFEPNKDYIISFDMRTSSDNFNQGGMLNIARGDSSHAYLANTSFKTNCRRGQLTHVSCTGHSYNSLDKNGETFYLNCLGLGQCDWVDVVNLKIAQGTIDKGYSPAPSDNATVTQIQSLTATIDGVQSNVINLKNDTSSKVTQLSNAIQSKVSTNDYNSKISQLASDINLRVTMGDLLSQINLEAGNTLIQSNKIYLDADSVVFGANSQAFIPSAAIENLDASKVTFYGANNTYATMGASVAQYDDDKVNSTINLQYNGGVELHSANDLGSILTMHDQNIRLAVKSNGMAEFGEPTDQYSGMYVTPGYTLLNSYQRDGTTSGIAIGSCDSGINKDYRIVIYDGSKSYNNLSKGVQVTGYRFDTSVGSSNLRSRSWITVHGDNEAWLEGGNQQIHMHNGEIVANNMSGNSTTGVHLVVHGWATYDGYVEGMGWTTKSTLSSKTRIQPLDTADALNKIVQTDLTTYQYKAEVANGIQKRHAGPIIDDVNDVARYHTPNEFVNGQRTGRSDADIIGYLMGAIQELNKKINILSEAK